MNIKDDLLLESYYTAIELKLDQSFIQILKNEIERRNLNTEMKNQYYVSRSPKKGLSIKFQ